MRRQRVAIPPREAAALDRLLDAYLVTEPNDPGLADLARLRERLRNLDMDHEAYGSGDRS